MNTPLSPLPFSDIAERLWNARAVNQPISPLSVEYPSMTIEDAYQISKLLFSKRIQEPQVGGKRIQPVGRKIGLTSRAVQTQLGVNQPDFGYLTSDMVVETGGSIAPHQLIQGRVEGEVAFVLGRDLKGPGVTFENVIRATDHVLACIEVIDSRISDWKIKIQDTVADNASSAFLVLGTRPRLLTDLDLRIAGMTLRLNGEVESTGVGAACLEHPVNAVAWLANTLGILGEGLRAGDIVLSGAYGPVVPFKPGDQCEVEISGLGQVRCRLGDLERK